MKVAAEQIDQLYLFTRQHYVEYYDLQSELVDHLANAIELQWKENPQLSFDAILAIEFKKFGVFGFMDVIEERKNALTKKYNLLVWNHFKAFFGFPKIIATLASVFIIYNLFIQLQFGLEVFIILFGTVSSAIIFKLSKTKKKLADNQKKWFFEDIILSYGTTTGLLPLPFHLMYWFYNMSKELLETEVSLLILASVFVFYTIFSYIMVVMIPSKANAYLTATYPEYEIATM